MPEPREFRWGAQVLPDPDPSMSPQDVRDYYSTIHAELTTAAVVEKGISDGTQVVAFEKQAALAKAAGGGKKSYEFQASQGRRG